MTQPRARHVLLCMLTVACATDPAREADRPFEPGLAAVEHLDVQPRPDPAWVRAVARGELPDSCTRIHGQRRERRGRLIRIALQTRRSRSPDCVQESRPFTRVLMIPLGELPSGLYTLEVNGVRGSFDVPRRRESWPDEEVFD